MGILALLLGPIQQHNRIGILNVNCGIVQDAHGLHPAIVCCICSREAYLARITIFVREHILATRQPCAIVHYEL